MFLEILCARYDFSGFVCSGMAGLTAAADRCPTTRTNKIWLDNHFGSVWKTKTDLITASLGTCSPSKDPTSLKEVSKN